MTTIYHVNTPMTELNYNVNVLMVVWWITRYTTKPGVGGSISRSSGLLDEILKLRPRLYDLHERGVRSEISHSPKIKQNFFISLHKLVRSIVFYTDHGGQ